MQSVAFFREKEPGILYQKNNILKMYQSRSLSRHHFVVADAAPLIYCGVREINYCFPQSLFCLYVLGAARRPSLFSMLFLEVDEVWEMGLFLLGNVMRNKAHA